MKKLFLLLLLIMITKPLLMSETIQTFDNLTKPGCLHVADNRIYITQESTLFVYDLNTFKLLLKLGSVGEGPG